MYRDIQIFDLYYVNTNFAWLFLLVSIPLWFLIYMYLDAVVPSEYGINKHPCFCCRREEKVEVYDNSDMESGNASHFYSN
jgi:hypothetical protein